MREQDRNIEVPTPAMIADVMAEVYEAYVAQVESTVTAEISKNKVK